MVDDIERETPLGFFNYGASYRAAADTLMRSEHRSIHPHAPVQSLYYHAIELVLKAFLRANGVSVAALKRMGHQLDKLQSQAVKLGLQFDQEDSAVIESIGAGDLWSHSRYLVTGFRRDLPLSHLASACRRVEDSVAAALMARGLLTRRLRSKAAKLTN